MKLRQYLDKEKITVAEFSRRCKIHPNHMFNIINGSRRPSLDLARRIQENSANKVQVDELVPKAVCCPTCGRKCFKYQKTLGK